jgi:hypothetical protein
LGYVAPTVGASRFLQQAGTQVLDAAGVGLTRILGFVALALTPTSMGTGDELNRPMTLADFNRLPPINNKLAPPGFPGDELENHHWLPQEFKSWFEAAPRNFNIENFREEIPMQWHRGADIGLHSQGYNAGWRTFIEQNPGASYNQTTQFLNQAKTAFGY